METIERRMETLFLETVPVLGGDDVAQRVSSQVQANLSELQKEVAHRAQLRTGNDHMKEDGLGISSLVTTRMKEADEDIMHGLLTGNHHYSKS
ncbi:hypothetical protein NDU88_002541 [Pleurodeles waltl]|uniref:Uncharacterized protein n=1 Tax=Pleurodeles waltl TaxID=8319 RepID=A0AAV7PEB2_PLEWA|nr:hypothetical protein NDU88_002541 [Pleurodeles waltl]